MQQRERGCTMILVLTILLLTGCQASPESSMRSLSVDQLRTIVTQEPEGTRFLFAAQELGRRGQSAGPAAPTLARALAQGQVTLQDNVESFAPDPVA